MYTSDPADVLRAKAMDPQKRLGACFDCGAAEPPPPDTRGLPAVEAYRVRARAGFPTLGVRVTAVSDIAVACCHGCYAKRYAAERAAEAEAFRALLTRKDISHVTARSWCGVDQFYVYRVAPESPSGCECIGGAYETETTREILRASGRGLQGPGEMGYAACAAGMRGR